MTTETIHGKRWPFAVAAVLIGQVAFSVWMARLAGSDPHFAVEPDYYERAVRWDATMAQARVDRALGWRAHATLDRTNGDSAVLRVTLADSMGVPVDADSVIAMATAVAYSGTTRALSFTRVDDSYVAMLPSARQGLWDVSLQVARGADRFTARLRTELRATTETRYDTAGGKQRRPSSVAEHQPAAR